MPYRCDGPRYKGSKKTNAMKVREDVRIFKIQNIIVIDAGV
jgi:hypothetical protein